MSAFHYHNDLLHVEDCSLQTLAEKYGTPSYIYSRQALEETWLGFDNAFQGVDHLVCYAVKANSNLALLNLLARLGSGFDIVSVGELERVLKAGGDPAKVVFAGVGKRCDEIERALVVGIRCFNVESESELLRINDIAARIGKAAPIALRVNPDVDAQTHPYISTGLHENKFGIPMEMAYELYLRAKDMPNIEILGIGCHIGSQLTSIAPIRDALQLLLTLVDQLEAVGVKLKHIDIGGGLGICYRDEEPPKPDDYAAMVCNVLGKRTQQIVMEPGRAIVGNSAVLLTKVEYLKHTPEHHFVIVDAAMNDLMRPALYDAWQAIRPVRPRKGKPVFCDIVGPVCESADFLGKQRELCVGPGDLLAIYSAGAYGFSMSSQYNSRPRAAEVLVDGHQSHCIRTREVIADLMVGEMIPNY